MQNSSNFLSFSESFCSLVRISQKSALFRRFSLAFCPLCDFLTRARWFCVRLILCIGGLLPLSRQQPIRPGGAAARANACGSRSEPSPTELVRGLPRANSVGDGDGVPACAASKARGRGRRGSQPLPGARRSRAPDRTPSTYIIAAAAKTAAACLKPVA